MLAVLWGKSWHVQEYNTGGRTREEGENQPLRKWELAWLEGETSWQDQRYTYPHKFPRGSVLNRLLCLSIWMCRSKSIPCWAALPALTLVLNFLATSNPVVFSNITNPALQQVFSDACKVALGYKALYRPLLLMLQSKQTKKKKANDYTYK